MCVCVCVYACIGPVFLRNLACVWFAFTKSLDKCLVSDGVVVDGAADVAYDDADGAGGLTTDEDALRLVHFFPLLTRELNKLMIFPILPDCMRCQRCCRSQPHSKVRLQDYQNRRLWELSSYIVQTTEHII